MPYTTIFLLKARKELLHAWEWYEDRQPGLGDRFTDELFNHIHEIEINPEQYNEKKPHYREIPINIFPYLIIYRINQRKKAVVVVSIFHTSRNPQKKYGKK